jgi:serine/threonine-protein kinase RsbW
MPDNDGGMMKRSRTSKLKLAQAADSGIPWTTVEFHSCLNKARSVECEILDACKAHRFREDDLFAIKLALEEALVNAVKHGNKLDPEKIVRIQYRVTHHRADITIEDQGPGFNPAELPDPTAEENLEMTSGRGILLMRAYMSSVVFNPSGNRVTLTKFNDGYSQAALG